MLNEQTNNRIREEWEKGLENIIYDSYQIIDSNGRGFENVKWFVDKLLKSQEHKLREELVEKIKEKLKYSICQNCGTDETIMAITDDIINLIKE